MNVFSDGEYLYCDIRYTVNSFKKRSFQKVIKASDFMKYASEILKERQG